MRKKRAKPISLTQRLYEPVWAKLKEESAKRIATPDKPHVRLSCINGLHFRIIKAVTKEKWMDLGYKIQLGELGKSAELAFIRKKNMIEINLIHTIGVDDL